MQANLVGMVCLRFAVFVSFLFSLTLAATTIEGGGSAVLFENCALLYHPALAIQSKDYSAGFSLEFWVQSREARLPDRTFFSLSRNSNGVADDDNFLQAGLFNTLFDWNAKEVDWTSVVDYTPNWHHYAFTFSAANETWRYYYDGALVLEANDTIAWTSDGVVADSLAKMNSLDYSLVIGNDQDTLLGNFATSSCVSAALDDLRFFSKPLSPQEVELSMNTVAGSLPAALQTFAVVEVSFDTVDTAGAYTGIGGTYRLASYHDTIAVDGTLTPNAPCGTTRAIPRTIPSGARQRLVTSAQMVLVTNLVATKFNVTSFSASAPVKTITTAPTAGNLMEVTAASSAQPDGQLKTVTTYQYVPTSGTWAGDSAVITMDTATETVTFAANTPPTLASTLALIGEEDTRLLIQVPVTDADGDEARMKIINTTCPAGSLLDITETAVVPGSDGVGSAFYFDPPPHAWGLDLYSVYVEAHDRHGGVSGTMRIVITINPSNDVPYPFDLPASVSVPQGTNHTFLVNLTDVDGSLESPFFQLLDLPHPSIGSIYVRRPGQSSFSHLDHLPPSGSFLVAKPLSLNYSDSYWDGDYGMSQMLGPPDCGSNYPRVDFTCAYFNTANNCTMGRRSTSKMFSSDWFTVKLTTPLWISSILFIEYNGIGSTVGLSVLRPGFNSEGEDSLAWHGLWAAMKGPREVSSFEKLNDHAFFQPKICSPVTVVDTVLVEFDTCNTPGWNGYDTMEVLGYESPPGAMLSHDSEILFVPHPDFEGTYNLTYILSDCYGDSTRRSETSSISFTFTHVRDSLRASSSDFSGISTYGTAQSFSVSVVDIDGAPTVTLSSTDPGVVVGATPTSTILKPAPGSSVTPRLHTFDVVYTSSYDLCDEPGARAFINFTATSSMVSTSFALAFRSFSNCPEPTNWKMIGPIVGAGSLLVIVASAVALYFFISGYLKRQAELVNLRNAPVGEDLSFAIVFTDIQSSTALWRYHGASMANAIELHHKLMRHCIRRFRGYEVKTIGDSFMIAFTSAIDAMAFALDAQQELMIANWGTRFQQHKHASVVTLRDALSDIVPGVEEATDLNLDMLQAIEEDGMTSAELARIQLAKDLYAGQFGGLPANGLSAEVNRGLRVRIACHFGSAQLRLDETTHRPDYYGQGINYCSRLEGKVSGSQIGVSPAFLARLEEERAGKVLDVIPSLTTKDVEDAAPSSSASSTVYGQVSASPDSILTTFGKLPEKYSSPLFPPDILIRLDGLYHFKGVSGSQPVYIVATGWKGLRPPANVQAFSMHEDGTSSVTSKSMRISMDQTTEIVLAAANQLEDVENAREVNDFRDRVSSTPGSPSHSVRFPEFPTKYAEAVAEDIPSPPADTNANKYF